MSVEENYLPLVQNIVNGIYRGRVVKEGYQRGWGLQYGNLRDMVLKDPLYIHAMEQSKDLLANFSEPNRMNIFLILKFFLPRLPPGNIIEFGSYRGGSAIFMGSVLREVLPGCKVYALDTFEGMPQTDPRVDAHSIGNFNNTSAEQVAESISKVGLENIILAKGLFEVSTPAVLRQAGPIALAHIDCDIRSGCNYARTIIQPNLVEGAYVVFDDATISSCIGATEAVEQMVYESGVFSEQIWPHYVFRHGLRDTIN
jgi:predicted O-methyltransferase YrrM